MGSRQIAWLLADSGQRISWLEMKQPMVAHRIAESS
jgi:hypothetical protein